MKRLDLVVGPNGAGKSTFIELVLAPVLARSVVVNADEIAKRRGQTLIAETVFSHPSKLELLRDAHLNGYEVVVHVLLVPEDLAVERVARRIRSGGPSVPEGKIRERHRRLWPLVVAAIERADLAVAYDNSALAGPAVCARWAAGELIGPAVWPGWAPDPLAARWP